MAVKSIVDIEINDAAWQKFSASFQKYTDLLNKTPPVWAEVEKGTKGTGISFEKLTAALLAQAEFAHGLRVDHEKTAVAVAAQSSAWRSMARTTHSVASNIAGMTRDLIRWSAITGAVSGLLGGGSLWGIERLAESAAGYRRGALGLGTSVGQQRSFGANFGRLVDTDSFLGGVNESLHDVTKRGALYSGGLTQGDLASGDTGQVSVALLQSISKIIDATPDALLGNMVQARRLGQFGITLEDAERIKATPQGERAEYFQRYAANIQSLQLKKDELKAWQDLNVQLHLAGQQIETTFIRGLTPLAKPLAGLSDAFQRLVTTVLDVVKKDGWIEKLGEGMDWLAKKIGDKDFESKVETGIKAISDLAVGLGGFAAWVYRHLPGTGMPPPEGSPGGQQQWPMDRHPTPDVNPFFYKNINPFAPVQPDNSFQHEERLGKYKSDSDITPKAQWYQEGGPWPYGGINPKYEPWNKGSFQAIPRVTQAAYRTMIGGSPGNRFGAIESRFGLPPGLLDGIEMLESSGGRNNSTSSAGAMGPFQFLRSTWGQYGAGGNIMDEGDSANAAGRYFQKLLTEFGGDVGKAAAGYNWGEGNVESKIRQYGDQWRSHLPPETQAYVAKILRMVGGDALNSKRPVQVHVTVHDSPGGNPVASASQLVYSL